MAQLTDVQIAHWRRVLMLTLGPYALHMPVKDIQLYCDRLQSVLDTENTEQS